MNFVLLQIVQRVPSKKLYIYFHAVSATLLLVGVITLYAVTVLLVGVITLYAVTVLLVGVITLYAITVADERLKMAAQTCIICNQDSQEKRFLDFQPAVCWTLLKSGQNMVKHNIPCSLKILRDCLQVN